MKLATYSDGSRDGQLIVVSRDLTHAHHVQGVATRLQQVLDDWNFLAPQLEALYAQLNQGRLRHAFEFDAQRCMAPLPRSTHWREWRGEVGGAGTLRVGPWVRPAQGAFDAAGGASARSSPGWAVITGDVAWGVEGRDAVEAVRLVMGLQCWEGRDARDPSAVFCTPVAVTPDELGAAWRGGRLQPGADAERPLAMHWRIDGRRVAALEAALPKRWPQDAHFGDLIAAGADAQPLTAGTVLAWYPALDESVAALPASTRSRWDVLGAGGASLLGAIEPTHSATGDESVPLRADPSVHGGSVQ